MSYFIPLIIVALVFWILGRYDKECYLKFQRDVITDALNREEALIDRIKELQSEIVIHKSMEVK